MFPEGTHAARRPGHLQERRLAAGHPTPACPSCRSPPPRRAAGRARASCSGPAWSMDMSIGKSRHPQHRPQSDELMREVERWIEAEMRRLDPEAYPHSARQAGGGRLAAAMTATVTLPLWVVVLLVAGTAWSVAVAAGAGHALVPAPAREPADRAAQPAARGRAPPSRRRAGRRSSSACSTTRRCSRGERHAS